MKKLAMILLLLTSCTGMSKGVQQKGFSSHACVAIDPSRIVCDSDAPGSAYEDALDAIKNSPKY